jgi:hypothetical protein
MDRGTIPVGCATCGGKNIRYFDFSKSQFYCASEACYGCRVEGKLTKIGFQSDLFTSPLVNRYFPSADTHQWLTQLAVEDFERRRNLGNDSFVLLKNTVNDKAGKRLLGSRRLISGNMYAEAPVENGENMNLVYHLDRASAERAVANRSETGGVVVDTRFRYQKRWWPIIATFVWRHVTQGAQRVFSGSGGVPDEYAHWHSMCASDDYFAHKTDAERLKVCVAKIRRHVELNLEKAIEEKDLFWLGVAMHAVQDSYACGHVRRQLLNSSSTGVENTVKSVVVEIMCIDHEAQDYHTHADRTDSFLRLDPTLRGELVGNTAEMFEVFFDAVYNDKKPPTTWAREFVQRAYATLK